TSAMTLMASGWTKPAGFEPALWTLAESPSAARKKPSPRWLRQELPVQRMRMVGLEFVGINLIEFLLIPAARLVADFADGQHHRHFDEHADDRRQRRAGTRAEERDRHGHRQLEEIARADERAGRGDVVRH